MCASCAGAPRAANGAGRTLAANLIITQTNTQTYINFQNMALSLACASKGQLARMTTEGGQTLFLLALDQWTGVEKPLR
jgi:hypothetical protein